MKTITLTLKLTEAERSRLDELVQARAADLLTLTGQRIDVTASGYLRWLMDRDAQARGLGASSPAPSSKVEAAPVAAPAPPTSSEAAAVPPKAQAEKLDPARVRADVIRLIESGTIKGSELAKSARVDAGQLSRFRTKGENVSPEKLRAIAAVCKRFPKG